MNKVKKILVGLDLSELDPTIIRFAAYIADHSSTTDIYFLNCIKNLELPEELKKEFPDLINNAIEDRKALIAEKIDDHFQPTRQDVKTHIDIVKGQATKKFLSLSKKHQFDLIIIGRKKRLKGTGVLANRLARRANCSLLIVPENSEPRLERLLVPSDFSPYSELAFKEAIRIASKADNKVEVICQNVYTVPVGYHYSGKNYKQFAKHMNTLAQRNYHKFIKKFKPPSDLSITPMYSLDKNDDPVEVIRKLANRQNVDAIIIGAKGRTAATAIFLGSMAERLVQKVAKIPLMVVRPKGKNAGFLEYLKEL